MMSGQQIVAPFRDYLDPNLQVQFATQIDAALTRQATERDEIICGLLRHVQPWKDGACGECYPLEDIPEHWREKNFRCHFHLAIALTGACWRCGGTGDRTVSEKCPECKGTGRASTGRNCEEDAHERGA